MTEKKTFTVFYSWQSDSPAETNLRLLREGLREAATRLEGEHASEGLHIVVDEATRDVPGSPNIPQTIMDKIRNADALVGDITTINPGRKDGTRACPNPNVAVELGYAIATLGWNRLVLLFNKAYGAFPDDAPFDIDRHRLSDYSISATDLRGVTGTRKEVAARAKNAKRPLFELLYDALKLILAARPPKPAHADELTPEERMRRRDVETLREVLATIHAPTMDEFIYDIQSGTMSRRIFHFWESFHAYVTSSLFHLYDPVPSTLVAEVHEAWGKSLSFGEHFTLHPSGKQYSFRTPGDLFSDRQQQAWEEMQACAAETRKHFAALLKEVRERYVEIDIKQASRDAWTEYVDFRGEMTKAFGKTD